MIRDGSIWKKFYQNRWPNEYFWESSTKVNPSVQDWFGLYKQRFTTEKRFSIAIIDAGSNTLKYGFKFQSEQPINDSYESIVAVVLFYLTVIQLR